MSGPQGSIKSKTLNSIQEAYIENVIQDEKKKKATNNWLKKWWCTASENMSG